jgi:hypothetical protein
MPWAVVGGQNFWRYVKPGGTLHFGMLERNWDEAVLKNHDIAATNPMNSWPDEKTVLGSHVVYEGRPELSPSTYLPYDLPEGPYEVWAYVKNTSGIPHVLKADYPRDLHTAKLPDAAWIIPAASGWGWVKLQPFKPGFGAQTVEHNLSGGARLWFNIDPYVGGQIVGSALNNGGELAFKSLYLERV